MLILVITPRFVYHKWLEHSRYKVIHEDKLLHSDELDEFDTDEVQDYLATVIDFAMDLTCQTKPVGAISNILAQI